MLKIDEKSKEYQQGYADAMKQAEKSFAKLRRKITKDYERRCHDIGTWDDSLEARGERRVYEEVVNTLRSVNLFSINKNKQLTCKNCNFYNGKSFNLCGKYILPLERNDEPCTYFCEKT